MVELTSKQRKSLEKMAHNLDPVVIVGGAGVTDSLKGMVAECLKTHELIKVKFNEFHDERFELTDEIVRETDATLVRIIGNVAILYRQNDDPKKRKIIVK